MTNQCCIFELYLLLKANDKYLWHIITSMTFYNMWRDLVIVYIWLIGWCLVWTWIWNRNLTMVVIKALLISLLLNLFKWFICYNITIIYVYTNIYIYTYIYKLCSTDISACDNKKLLWKVVEFIEQSLKIYKKNSSYRSTLKLPYVRQFLIWL